MKKYLYLIISFSLMSCYTYRSNTEKDGKPQDTSELKPEEPAGKAMANSQASVSAIEFKGPRKNKVGKGKIPTPNPTTIQEKLEANKFYKIEVADKSYKIQVDKWVSDTLVAHVIHKPRRILKFHKNQINQTTIAERRFSQPAADIITVAAYAGIGVLIWSLVK